MHLILKTVSGKKHEMDVEESTTVNNIKLKLQDEYDVNSLKLCYKGAILEDSKTVESYKLIDNDTIIISGKKRTIAKMVANKPASKVQSTVTSEDTSTISEQRKEDSKTAVKTPSEAEMIAQAAKIATSTLQNQPELPSPETQIQTHTEPLSTAVPPVTAPPLSSSISAPVESSVSTSLVDEIVAMGFEDRAQVAMALRAAYMNPDRAIEYLCSGIPENVRREMQPLPQPHLPSSTGQQQQQQSFGSVSSSSTLPPAEGIVEESSSNNQSTSLHPSTTSTSTASNPTVTQSTTTTTTTTTKNNNNNNASHNSGSELRRLLQQRPWFDMMRQAIQADPNIMESVIMRLQVEEPVLYETINQNPEEFLSIVFEPVAPGTSATPPFPQSGSNDSNNAYSSNAPIMITPQNTDLVLAQIERQFPPLTESDNTSISELVVLGGGLWDERAAKLVYRVTRGNMEFAGSILFETGGNIGEILRLIQAMQAEAAAANRAHAGEIGEHQDYDQAEEKESIMHYH